MRHHGRKGVPGRQKNGQIVGSNIMRVGRNAGSTAPRALASAACYRPRPAGRGTLCLAGTVSKSCWPFYTATLRRKLTRLRSIVGMLTMAVCQWASKSIVSATEVSSLLWWKVLEEREKSLTSITTDTAVPHCVLSCRQWAALVGRYFFLSVSSPLSDPDCLVTRISRSKYALQENSMPVVRHCWR